MSAINKVLLAGVAACVGVLASVGTAYASTPTGTQVSPAANAQTVEHRDNHGDLDGHTDGDHQAHPRWIHYDRYGWYPGEISAAQCGAGGGHINFDREQCDGGRFDDYFVRP